MIYAMKIISPDGEDEDVSEIVELAILKFCDHPNIISLFGTWKKEEEIFVSNNIHAFLFIYFFLLDCDGVLWRWLCCGFWSRLDMASFLFFLFL